ncbi:Fur family transcriptional regulator [Brockia lithotrophica]|uniref:ferric iron uptake transcriptional regulator n=1 Tax=Brockia lithotrophica TaxID=933949 RepID=UPI000EABC06F|nr:transcriptional repressor [Brockia lithotrophica]
MEDRVERIRQILQAHNYKMTPQREATVRVLLEHEDRHLSAEEIFLLLKERVPDIGLATVYRTLELLSDLEIVYKVNFGDGVTRYDFRKEGMARHHHHLQCIRCGKVEEIHENLLADVEKLVEERYGFKVLDHRLTFLGICRECQEREEREKAAKEGAGSGTSEAASSRERGER